MPRQMIEDERAQVYGMLLTGKSVREVAKFFKICPSTVSRIKTKYDKFQTFRHLGGNGRQSVLSDSVVRTIQCENAKNPKLSLRKMKVAIQNKLDIEISHMTVKKCLNSSGLKAFSPSKKPLLSKKNITLRYSISSMWLKMSMEEIKTVIFSDESKFNLFYTSGKCSVWRKPKTRLALRNITPTVKYGGGSVMVWGCFSYYGVGRLLFIDGKMDAGMYCNILANNLLSYVEEIGLSDYIFQQDNDPKHTSKLVRSFLEEKNIKLLAWPSQSPDMNPIETLWGIIKEKVAKRNPKNIKILKDTVLQVWNEISQDLTMKLVTGFKDRALALYRAKGMHTKF